MFNPAQQIPRQRGEEQSADESVTASKLDGFVLIALLFSCCLLPVVLPALAWVAAWLTSLPAFAIYRPLWLTVLLAASVFGWTRVYRPRVASGAARPGFGAKVILNRPGFSGGSNL